MTDYRRLWVEGVNEANEPIAIWLNLKMVKYIQYVNYPLYDENGFANNNVMADVRFIDGSTQRLYLRIPQAVAAAQESLGLRVRTFPITTTSGGPYSYTGKAAAYGGGDRSYKRILANQIDITTNTVLGKTWLNLDQVKYVLFGNLPGVMPHMVVYFDRGSNIAVERGFLSLGQPDSKENHQLWHDNFFIKNYDQITFVGTVETTAPGYLVPYN